MFSSHPYLTEQNKHDVTVSLSGELQGQRAEREEICNRVSAEGPSRP